MESHEFGCQLMTPGQSAHRVTHPGVLAQVVTLIIPIFSFLAGKNLSNYLTILIYSEIHFSLSDFTISKSYVLISF